MKGRYLFFAACLGCLAFFGARADDDASVARAAARRVSGNAGATANQTRQKNSTNDTTTRPTAAATRNTNASTKSATTGGRTVGARPTVVHDSTRAAADATTASRGAVTPRNTQNTVVQSRQSSGAKAATISRTAVQARETVTPSVRAVTGDRATTSSRARTATSTTLARAATNNELRDAIMGRDYKSCRRVYYECMDEFCANKDAQLKRCACSSRMHEFDKYKKQLSNVEDKLLDFNQRLLTVNMDKEDAAALNVATEGELAFNKKDTSASKKLLNEISKKLNSSKDSYFEQNLSAISLSLNTDAAFDNVDSLMGASTTTKEGTELYNAALPICREMAAEVCDESSLSLAESGYQMTIEQDCNTIAKTYENRTDQAREKIREGSALLDISRLDIYQKRNSDDILTCKKKMLNQLYDTSVCGDNLGKCLDVSGQYIDPSTGQAFLTQNLANLSTLITRPSGDQTWTNAPGNDRFVSYLNSKKKYLAPATENCQDIADYVWTEFIDDALSQIKLAQDAKLEEVRQSCTSLTAQCLSTTAKSIEDFDARALSTFGVMADKTVNDMCADVRNACTALLETVGGAEDWVGGMTQIATEKTYETILHTCREVGRACIIQACKSVSGNFGMCENLQNSVNRKSIINRVACWDEVKQCVNEATPETINNIFEYAKADTDNENNSFYTELYGTTYAKWNFYNKDNNSSTCHMSEDNDITKKNYYTCIDDICTTECGCWFNNSEYTCKTQNTKECRVCRLAEKIWGNCEAASTADITAKGSHNRILIPKDTSKSTLLSWFAQNTGSQNETDSCRDTSCPAGYTASGSGNNIRCINAENYINNQKYFCEQKYRFNNGTSCCRTGKWGDDEDVIYGQLKPSVNGNTNCCIGTWVTPTNTVPYGTGTQISLCVNNSYTDANIVVNGIKLNEHYEGLSLVCISDNEPSGQNIKAGYPSGKTIKCDGQYIFVDANGNHIDPLQEKAFMSYSFGNDGETPQQCVYDAAGYQWNCNAETKGIMIRFDGHSIGE